MHTPSFNCQRCVDETRTATCHPTAAAQPCTLGRDRVRQSHMKPIRFSFRPTAKVRAPSVHDDLAMMRMSPPAARTSSAASTAACTRASAVARSTCGSSMRTRERKRESRGKCRVSTRAGHTQSTVWTRNAHQWPTATRRGHQRTQQDSG